MSVLDSITSKLRSLDSSSSPEAEDTCIEDLDMCYDVVIIGGGVAGLSAAIYTTRDGFRTLVLEGEPLSSVDLPGGALMLTEMIENFPGFMAGEGMELISSIRAQAGGFGAEIKGERATKVAINPRPGKTHKVTTSSGTYRAKSIIIATGALARQLGVKGEDTYYGQGVSTCATCDGFFYKGKTVAVVGGGDTAVEDALVLTRYAEKVYLMPRRDELKASGPEARNVLDHPKVEILWSSNLTEIKGNGNSISEVDYVSKNVASTVAVDGVFVAIGRIPVTSFLAGTPVQLDEEGYILTEASSTRVLGNAPGVFAAGDCVDKVYRQAITSAGKAVEAALDARTYLLSSHN